MYFNEYRSLQVYLKINIEISITASISSNTLFNALLNVQSKSKYARTRQVPFLKIYCSKHRSKAFSIRIYKDELSFPAKTIKFVSKILQNKKSPDRQ